jgi:hypothetical protein
VLVHLEREVQTRHAPGVRGQTPPLPPAQTSEP